MKRGMFIVFEGIDACGKSTQLWELAKNIERRNKYLDIVRTHEPWHSEEIKRRLKEEKDAYSNPLEMAALFVYDRILHTKELIMPDLEKGVFVLCDRYSMSTCAYQWTQGADIGELIKMHENKGIMPADITFLIDVPVDVCAERMEKRGDSKEKFESMGFQRQLRDNYDTLRITSRAPHNNYGNLFGKKIAVINGNQPVRDVSLEIDKAFETVYKEWLKSENAS